MRGKQEIKPPWFFDLSRFVSLLPKYPKQHFFIECGKKESHLPVTLATEQKYRYPHEK